MTGLHKLRMMHKKSTLMQTELACIAFFLFAVALNLFKVHMILASALNPLWTLPARVQRPRNLSSQGRTCCLWLSLPLDQRFCKADKCGQGHNCKTVPLLHALVGSELTHMSAGQRTSHCIKWFSGVEVPRRCCPPIAISLIGPWSSLMVCRMALERGIYITASSSSQNLHQKRGQSAS